MIDFNKEVFSALNKILPTHYENALTNYKLPCISYMELTNVDSAVGNTIGYSRISFDIKIWDTSIKGIQGNSIKVDSAMRALGFKRTSTATFNDKSSTVIQKVLTYECLALETY